MYVSFFYRLGSMDTFPSLGMMQEGATSSVTSKAESTCIDESDSSSIQLESESDTPIGMADALSPLPSPFTVAPLKEIRYGLDYT